ncbi:MAG: thermonuclease family protein [Pseudomonadota bacterium]
MAVEAQNLKGTASVIDGDSLIVAGIEVRLHGMDAPELDQTCLDENGETWACGEAAKDALTELVSGGPVTCRRALHHSRYIGDCRVRGENLSAQMLAKGHAVVDRRGSRKFVGHESIARRAKLNLWAGEFEWPWRWRDQDYGASGATYLFSHQRTVSP